jgi:hypothetical protein
LICYFERMTRETTALLYAFEHLPTEEKRAFTEEAALLPAVRFRSLEDEAIGAVSAALFQSLDGQGSGVTSETGRK